MKLYHLFIFVWVLVTTMWLLNNFGNPAKRRRERRKAAEAARKKSSAALAKDAGAKVGQ
jgi:hypothetical protein